MLMVGNGSDFEEIQDIIKRKKLSDYFIFTGVIRDMKIREALYQIADLFVFPSVCDNAAIVILEAATQKTPTICIKNTFQAEIITDKHNGYLSILDKEKFALDTASVLENEDLNKQVGENAYNEILNKDLYEKSPEDYTRLIKNKRK